MQRVAEYGYGNSNRAARAKYEEQTMTSKLVNWWNRNWWWIVGTLAFYVFVWFVLKLMAFIIALIVGFIVLVSFLAGKSHSASRKGGATPGQNRHMRDEHIMPPH